MTHFCTFSLVFVVGLLCSLQCVYTHNGTEVPFETNRHRPSLLQCLFFTTYFFACAQIVPYQFCHIAITSSLMVIVIDGIFCQIPGYLAVIMIKFQSKCIVWHILPHGCHLLPMGTGLSCSAVTGTRCEKLSDPSIFVAIHFGGISLKFLIFCQTSYSSLHITKRVQP